MTVPRNSETTTRRVLVKLSGETLGGKAGSGLDADVLRRTAQELIGAAGAGPGEARVELAVVVGAGNFLRGAAASAGAGIRRVTADHMGMLATTMNALALGDALEEQGASARVLATPAIAAVAEGYSMRRARELLAAGAVVLLAGGTGNPLFTTDTAACLRAIEISADLVVKWTKVDGVYSADPATTTRAERFDEITFAEVIAARLGVMDLTAAALCEENGMPVVVCDTGTPGALTKAVRGDKVGTRIVSGTAS